MTCIVGIAHEGRVYIGGDSAGVDGRGSLSVRADKKVFKNGPFVMGFTSSFRMGNLLQHSLTPPRRHPEDDVSKFMVTEFIDAVRKCLKDGGYATKRDDGEAGGSFLVGYAGRLFVIDDDYQVGEEVCGFAAVGSGDRIALGSLFSTTATSDPQERLKTALAAAEQFTSSVRGPFAIISSEVQS